MSVGRERSSVRSIGLVLLIVQVVLAGSLLYLNRQAASAIPAAPDPAAWDLPVPDTALSIESGVERANDVAQAWHLDATLVFVSIQVDWPTSDPPETVTGVSPFGWLRLLYVAPVDGASTDYASLSLLFERVSGALTGASVGEWGNTPNGSSLFDNVAVSSETAILAGEIAGGTEFRAACPQLRSQSGTTLTADPATGERFWTIVYRDRSEGSTGPMRLTVSAQSGNVQDVRNGSPTCVT